MSDGLVGIRPEVQPVPQEAPERELSNVEADEQAYEQLPESKDDFLEEAPVTIPVARDAAPKSPARTAAAKDEITLHVERIMEEGLGELYASLPEEARPVFKKRGEEAAVEISKMVRTFKVQAAKVLRLLRNWLLTIPKVNRFFLEQEAKIKTDLILEMVEDQRRERTGS